MPKKPFCVILLAVRKMEQNTIISVSENLATVVSSRDVAFILKKLIDRATSKIVDLDFQKVDFVSRSAAHELLLLKEKFARRIFKKKTVSFINTNNDVSAMLKAVASSRAMPKPEVPHLNIQKIDIKGLSKLVTS